MFYEACWLIRNGVPFDVAFDMDETIRTAMAINFSRFEGGTFNVERLEWEKDE